MSERFQLFRLSLLRRKQIDMFYENEKISRVDYLKLVFSESYAFDYRSAPFHFEPDKDRSSDDVILGRLGRPVQIEENLSPDEGLKEASHLGWLASIIAIDPTDHEDGQKASVQIDARVGTAAAIFSALIDKINDEHKLAPFFIDAEPIFDASTFWDFARENSGRITTLTFEYVSPNGPWNSASSIKEGMKQYQEMTGANKVINTLKNEDGLNTDNEFVKASVDYAEAGSGKIRAKAKGGKTFNSTKSMKTVKIEEVKSEDGPKSLLSFVSKHIAKVLGREQDDSNL